MNEQTSTYSNWKMVAMKLGEGLKYETTLNDIHRNASVVFGFERREHPVNGITSSRSQLLYDWVMTLSQEGIPEDEKQSLLRNFISMFDLPWNPFSELLDDKSVGLGKSESFWDMIHPMIIETSESRFNDGYYSDSVERALKRIVKRVQKELLLKTGKERDGVDLMHNAFSTDNPIIVLGDLSTTTGRNIQEGFRFIFAGSIAAIRNPGAHENLDEKKERAIHYLYLASLLMHQLDGANVP